MRSTEDLLDPVDANWFRMERKHNFADIVSVTTFEGRLEPERMRELLETRLLTHRRFKKRVVDDSPLGLLPPRWEDEAGFSLDQHWRRATVPPPGDEAALLKVVEEIANVPLDFTRSPWRSWLLDGLEGDRSAIVSHVHHCMGDGFALTNVMLSMTDQGVPAPAANGGPGHESSWSEAALKLARTAQADASALAHLLLMPPDHQSVLRGKCGGVRRLAASAARPLPALRAAAKARSTTVNDVIMASIAGALRRYLVERGAAAPGVRAIVPVNLRPPTVPVDEEHGNYFGLIFVALPLDEADREARLRIVKQDMDRVKGNQEATVSLGIMHLLGRAPAVVDRIVDELFSMKGTIVVTNVPGPRGTLSMGGQPIRDMLFWVPHPGLASGVSVMSYNGTVRIGVRTDAAVVPDPERIARYLEEELDSW